MRNSPLAAALLLAASFAVIACGPPVKNTPIAEIPALPTLKDVMDNQATTADPQFSKRSNTSFSDADYAGFTEASQRIGATSLKIKDFTKGAEFDALAMKLHDKADALGKAAAAKDAAASSAALNDMKATCKECHSKFR